MIIFTPDAPPCPALHLSEEEKWGMGRCCTYSTCEQNHLITYVQFRLQWDIRSKYLDFRCHLSSISNQSTTQERWIQCTVLCVTYCTTLYCTVLCSSWMFCTTLHYTVLYFTVLHSTVLYCTALYCTILHYTVLYTVLYYTTLHTVLYYTVLHTVLRALDQEEIRHHSVRIGRIRRNKMMFFQFYRCTESQFWRKWHVADALRKTR